MKRNIVIFIAISFGILFSLVLVSDIISVNSKKLTTDSGFDSSWDSGGSSGSSGSSSWSSGSSDRSGSSGGARNRYHGRVDGEEIFYTVLGVAIFFIIGAILLLGIGVLISNAASLKKKKNNFLSSSNGNSIDAINSETTSTLSEFNLNKQGVLEGVFELIKKIFDGYSLGNINSVDDIISPAVKSYLIKKLVDNNSKGIIETFKNYKLKNGFVFCAEKHGEQSLSIKLEIMFSCLVDTKKEGTSLQETKNYCYTIDTLYENCNYKIISLKESNGSYVYTDRSFNNSISESFASAGFDKDEVLRNAYSIYVRVQNAWMNDTLGDVKDVISDEMYNQYNGQLYTMRVKDQQNVMGDFKYVDGFISSFKDNESSYRITVQMCVTCKDYLIKKSTGKVIRGNSSKINTYRYLLTFIIGKKDIYDCPNCGAPLDIKKASEVCEFCGSKIVKESDNMVLTDKKMISQS